MSIQADAVGLQAAREPTLKQRARDALLGLLLISEGATTNPNSTGSSKPGSRPPAGIALGNTVALLDESRHHYHRRRITQARTTADLEQAVEAAEECLRIHRGGEARHRESVNWERFIVERYPSWSTAQVAKAENCERMQVWRARKKHGVNGSNGLPIAA